MTTTMDSLFGKVFFPRFLQNRLLWNISPAVVPEWQRGFRSGKGTTNMFSARQLQERFIQERVLLYQICTNLKKAFDTVNRISIWMILGKLRCPRIIK